MFFLKRFFIKQTDSAELIPAKEWFKESSLRHGPKSPQDFNLLKVPRFPLRKWCEKIYMEPWGLHCTPVKIIDLGSISQSLSDNFKKVHNITTEEVLCLFSTYLIAACPKCFGGLTAELLQLIEGSKNVGGAVFLGCGSELQRILDGKCASCSSKEYFVIWLGDI